MSRDLASAATAELQAEYEPKIAKIRSLRAEAKSLEEEVEPLKAELTKREDKAILILNAVMAGQQALLRVAGLPAEMIAEAEERFAQMKATKAAAREHAAAGEAVSS